MTLSAPYRQKNYMGEYAAETGGGSALEFIQANKWDSSGDGAGTPRAGMMFFDTAAVAMKVYSGSAWAEIGGGAQLSDLSDVGDTTVGAGRLLISDADSWESQLVGGAITLSSSGATAFNATSEASADDADLVLIYDDDAAVYKRMTRANFLSGAGASQLSDLSDVGVTTATAGRLLVADGDSWESQTISGAITMASDGGTGFIADSELTADDADLLLIYDDSESEYRRMTRANFLSGVGASPGGSDGQIQWRDSGAFAGTDNAYWDDANDVLVLGGETTLPWTSTAWGVAVCKDSTGGYVSTVSNATAAQSPLLSFVRNKGASHASLAVVTSGDYLGKIMFKGLEAVTDWDDQSTGAEIRVEATETWSGSANGTTIKFNTKTNTTATLETRYQIEGNSDHVWYSAGASPSQIMRLDAANGMLVVGEETASTVEWGGIESSANNFYGLITGVTASETSAHMPSLRLVRARGTTSSPTVPTAGYPLGDVHFFGLVSGAWNATASAAYIKVEATETWSALTYGAKLEFSTTNTGTDGCAVRYEIAGNSDHVWYGAGNTPDERLRLENEGPILFPEISAPGTTTNRLYNTSTGLYFDGTRLDVAGASPSGSTPQLQYNDGAGDFAAATNVRYDSSDGVLIIGAYDDPAWSSSVYGLHVMRDGYAGINVSGASTTAAEIPIIKLTRTHGADHDNPGVIESGDGLGRINFDGTRTAAWNGQSIGVAFQAIASEAWGVSATGTKFELQTTTNATITATTRYEIDGDGDHVWYGAGATPSERLRLENEGPILFPEISAPGTTTNRLYNTSTGLYFDGVRLDATGTSNKIEEGDSSVEIVDAGTGNIQFTVDNAEVARMTDSLRIGDETDYLLSGTFYGQQIYKDGSSAGLSILMNSSTAAERPELFLARGNGSLAAPNVPITGQTLGAIAFGGMTTSAWSSAEIGVELLAIARSTWSGTNKASEFRINTVSAGNAAAATRYKITLDGDHFFYTQGESPEQLMKIDSDQYHIVVPSLFGQGSAVSGAFYYDTQATKFKFGENGSWVTYQTGATSPGGSDGQIQWRSSGAFAGTDAAYWNDTYNTLILGSSTTQTYSNATVGLDVHRDTSAYITIGSSSGSATPDTNVAAITLIKSRGTHASPAALTAGDHIGGMHFSGIAGASLSLIDTGALIRAYATETWGSSIAGTRLAIQTINTSVYGRADRYSIEGNSDHIWYGAGASSSQIFKLDATNIYAVAPSTASPASAAEGAFFYDTTADVFKFGQGASPSWVTIPTSVPSPGGSTPQLQYNDGAGDFAAATNVRYDSDNDVLMVGPFDSMHWSYSVYGLVVSKDDWAGMMMSAASDTAATSPFIILQRVGGTHASPTVTQNTHVLGSIAWNGLRTTGWSDMAQGAAIFATASQTWEMTKAGTKFEFKTATNDTATAATRYEIDGDGDHIWYGAGTSPSEQWRIVDGYSMYQRGIATVRENAFRGVEDVSYSFMVAGENATDFVPGLSLDVGDGSPALVFHSTHDTGSFASKVAVADEDLLGVISFLGWSGATNGYTPGAHIFVYVDGTPDTSNSPARIEFYTHDSNLDGATRYAIEGSGGHVWYGVGASPSQIFKLDAINIYAVASSRAGEPSSAAEGAFFYDTTADVFKFGQGASPAWVTIGTGDVSKVGTPANDQLAVWTGDGTLEGSTDISVDSSGHMSFGATNGAAMGVQNIAEEVTIPFTSGSGGIATSGNLAPADSLILAVTARVTDAPGGGATTFDVGITGSGNADELIDAVSTALNTQANSASDNDGTQLPIANGTATTLTVTTDVDVTDNDMKVRIVVWYLSLTEPTS